MALEDPKETVVNSNGDDDFERHFNEFAAGTAAPDPEEPPEEPSDKSEGNDPEEPAGDDPPPADPLESVTSDAEPPAGGDPPPAEQAPDPWAQVPPELKAQFEQIQRERDEARHKAQSDASRVAALSRKLSALQNGNGQQARPEKEEPNEAQKALDEKIAQLRKEYPEVAEPLIELIQAQRAEIGSMRQAVETVSQEHQAAYIAAEQAALEARHPDWRTIASNPDFSEWLEVQPPNIQRLAQSWDAHETGVALTLYKAERMAPPKGQQQEAPTKEEPAPAAPAAATDTKRSQQLEGGRDVRSRPAPASSGPPEDFEAAFAYFQAKAEAKRQTARAR